MFRRLIKAIVVDAEILNETTYPYEGHFDYTNDYMFETCIPTPTYDGNVGFQLHYKKLVIKYIISGEEFTTTITDCYSDRVLRADDTIDVIYDLRRKTVSLRSTV